MYIANLIQDIHLAALQHSNNNNIIIGGLGVRRVALLALPAFVASAASTLPLQDASLMNCACSNNSAFQNYLSLWSSAFGHLPEDLPSKQPFWDRPGVLADRAFVESQMNSPLQQASFLAASSSHSGDWLFALPIASCSLRLDDEAVRVAVGIRLCLPICVPHQCQCAELVDANKLVERQDIRPLMSWSRVRLCQQAFQLLRNPMAYLGQMAKDLMACL